MFADAGDWVFVALLLSDDDFIIFIISCACLSALAMVCAILSLKKMLSITPAHHPAKKNASGIPGKKRLKFFVLKMKTFSKM